MTERNYYVLCDDNCRFEGMTKEQIYDAIAEATGQTPTPVDEAFITMIKEQNANHNMKFWHGTEAQFNALEETDPDTVYVIGTNKVKSVDALEEAVSALQEEVQPVDRGGTGATSAANARINLLGGSGIVEKKLLWTNASPSSNFGQQTIPNITDERFDFVMAVFNGSTSLARKYVSFAPVGWYGEMGRVANVDATLTTLFLQRQFVLTGDGNLTFGACHTKQGTTQRDDNSYIIPIEVYGIREV